jgi:hypothetical protein
VQSFSPLIAWFFTIVLLLLAGRATARLVLARSGGGGGGNESTGSGGSALARAERNREAGHAAMGFGMAVLLAPAMPRPAQPVSVCFFAALAALATVDWARRLWAGRRGRTVSSCAPAEAGRLLDPHHAIVGIAMVVMLLRPSMGGSNAAMGGATGSATGSAVGSAAGVVMPGMAMGAAPDTTVLLLLGYVWVTALVLGYGMTRVLAVAQPDRGTAAALLSSPATVYACELAMTVLTGLMLLS